MRKNFGTNQAARAVRQKIALLLDVANKMNKHILHEDRKVYRAVPFPEDVINSIKERRASRKKRRATRLQTKKKQLQSMVEKLPRPHPPPLEPVFSNYYTNSNLYSTNNNTKPPRSVRNKRSQELLEDWRMAHEGEAFYRRLRQFQQNELRREEKMARQQQEREKAAAALALKKVREQEAWRIMELATKMATNHANRKRAAAN